MILNNMVIYKKNLIDTCFDNFNIKSVAEAGCVYGVDGVYSRYIAETKPFVNRLVMIDTNWNENAIEVCRKYSKIEIINDNFAEKDVIYNKIGNVDLVILFDVLLHQVSPDWYRVLQMYSEISDYILIYNPQYTKSKISIRLFDLGEEEYYNNIPNDNKNEGYYKDLFKNFFTYIEYYKRIQRDLHNIWQWGITDSDLLHVMDKLGFDLFDFQTYGLFYGLKNFENKSFIFKKRKL
ncbi:MAG: hypothetical protein AABZ74_06145 [Cyanobacteriota bacterium]